MRIIGIIIAAMLCATPALGDVGAYRWGMSREQAISAGHGLINGVQGDEGDRVFGSDLGAEGSYEAAGIAFKAQFYFDPAGRLSGIRLHPEDQSKCDDLLNMLEGIYGLGTGTGMGKSWLDAQSNNDLRFTSLSGECFVAYRPLSRSGALGL